MRCAVLGSPISHSLSPVMHRAAYAELGLDWTYAAIEVDAGGLAAFVAGLDDDWAGLSITAPLKREAAALATTSTDVVHALGVANTLIRPRWQEPARQREVPPGPGDWHAANTDVPGAVNALAGSGVTTVRSVRILGGGATADSMLMAVREIGAADVEVVVRSPEKVKLNGVSVRNLADPPEERVDLLVSTLPADVAAARAREWVGAAEAVFDVSYHPWPTPLAEAAGLDQPVVTGIDLLAHQAALQVELMTGQRVEPGVLRDAALSA
jgi:shikimate dehydrogenase